MDVKVVDQMLQVCLRDGRIIVVPLDWISLLSEATPNQRANVEIQDGGASLYWPETGAYLSVTGLLAGSDPVVIAGIASPTLSNQFTFGYKDFRNL